MARLAGTAILLLVHASLGDALEQVLPDRLPHSGHVGFRSDRANGQGLQRMRAGSIASRAAVEAGRAAGYQVVHSASLLALTSVDAVLRPSVCRRVSALPRTLCNLHPSG